LTSNDLKLKAILTDVLLIDDSQFRDESGPAEIETWDSLAMVEIAAALEREFNCDLQPEDVVMLDNIGQIKLLLGARGFEFAS